MLEYQRSHSSCKDDTGTEEVHKVFRLYYCLCTKHEVENPSTYQVAKTNPSTFKTIETKLGVRAPPVHDLTESLSEIASENDILDESLNQMILAPPNKKKH